MEDMYRGRGGTVDYEFYWCARCKIEIPKNNEPKALESKLVLPSPLSIVKPPAPDETVAHDKEVRRLRRGRKLV